MGIAFKAHDCPVSRVQGHFSFPLSPKHLTLSHGNVFAFKSSLHLDGRPYCFRDFSLDLKEKLLFFLAKVTRVSGLCDMVWLVFSSHYLGGLSPKAVTVLNGRDGQPPSHCEIILLLSLWKAQGCSIQPPDHLLPPTQVPISYPHPVRPISMFPLPLANLHNYSLPFSWNQIMVNDFPQVSVPQLS